MKRGHVIRGSLPGQRPLDVRVRWGITRRFFSVLLFAPSARVRLSAVGTSLDGATVCLQLRRFDARQPYLHQSHDGWFETDEPKSIGHLQVGKRWRSTLRVPPEVVSPDIVYSARLEIEEREKVDEDADAQITLSYFYLPHPIRVHSPGTLVALLSAAVSLIGAALSVGAAILVAGA